MYAKHEVVESTVEPRLSGSPDNPNQKSGDFDLIFDRQSSNYTKITRNSLNAIHDSSIYCILLSTYSVFIYIFNTLGPD